MSDKLEKTLILIKPDAVQRGLVGKIIDRFENKGLKIVGLKMMKLEKTILLEHYAHVVDKPFYQELSNFMSSNPVLAMCIEGVNAVESVRKLSGTHHFEFGTIRGDFASSTQRNLIHSSDSKEAAKREVSRFFIPDELFDYEKDEWKQVYAESEKD